MGRDPLRMYLVLHRGAIAELARVGELAGAAAVASLGVAIAEPGHAAASTNAAIRAALVAFIAFLAVAVSCAYEVSWRARADALRHGRGDSPLGRTDRPGGSPVPAAMEAAELGFSPR